MTEEAERARIRGLLDESESKHEDVDIVMRERAAAAREALSDPMDKQPLESQERLALQGVDLRDKLARVKLALALNASDGVLRADDYGRLYRAVCAAIADPDKEKT